MADMDDSTMLYGTAMSMLRSSLSAGVRKNVTQVVYPGAIPGRPTVFFFVVCILLSIAGTFLNSMTIWTISSLPTSIRKDASHTFILSLSVVDLLLSLIVIPMQLLQVVYRKVEPFGDHLCSISQLAFYWTFELSLFTLAVVSLNRMIKICYNPSYPRIFSETRMRIIIASLWILSFLLVLPPYFGIYGTYEVFNQTKGTGKYYCGIQNSSKSAISPRAFYLTIGFLIPFIVIPISYWRIYKAVRKHQSRFRGSNSDSRNYKFFQAIAVIFVSFIICFLPNMIFRGWMSYTTKFEYLRQLVKALMYGNTVVNPLIYFTMNAEYRNAFLRLIEKKKRRFMLGTRSLSKGPAEGRHVDRDPETSDTNLERSNSLTGQEGGFEMQRMSVMGEQEDDEGQDADAGSRRGMHESRMSRSHKLMTTNTIVIILGSLVGALVIFVLIADFIEHRLLRTHAYEI